jgi:hypothetical protein
MILNSLFQAAVLLYMCTAMFDYICPWRLGVRAHLATATHHVTHVLATGKLSVEILNFVTEALGNCFLWERNNPGTTLRVYTDIVIYIYVCVCVCVCVFMCMVFHGWFVYINNIIVISELQMSV